MSVKFPVKYPIGHLQSVEQRQKFGVKFGYGAGEYGTLHYAEPEEIAGIYRIRHYNGKKYYERMNFYPYVIKHSIPLDANRAKFASAVSAWQALAPAEKILYNKRAVGRHLFGYQLFLSEYMKI